jgi:hypothetical protein
MAKKKSSSTAALVEHNVADEEHPERLTLEETWPPEHLREQDDSGRGYETGVPDADDGTEPFAHREDITTPYQEIGLSSEGPFIAPAPVTPPDAPTTGKRSKQTVASMPRDLAFAKFRDSLFTLCFKFGFTLETYESGSSGVVIAVDVSDAKGSAKRALAVSGMADLELRK